MCTVKSQFHRVVRSNRKVGEWQLQRKVVQPVQQHCLVWISPDTY